jgi:hypothetical protein
MTHLRDKLRHFVAIECITSIICSDVLHCDTNMLRLFNSRWRALTKLVRCLETSSTDRHYDRIVVYIHYKCVEGSLCCRLTTRCSGNKCYLELEWR